MANIIISISFKNFYNYYGDYDRNSYSFRQGLNIIAADNGCGKSKFYNGILWILNNYVIESNNEKPEDIQVAAFKIISDKAKVETYKGKTVESGVMFIYKDLHFEYTIIKKVSALKTNDGTSTDESNWSMQVHEPEVSKRDLQLKSYKTVYDSDEKKKIISNIIDGKLQRYSLIQGEAIDNIVDLLSKDGLITTIETLTNIDRIKTLVKITAGLRRRAEDELRLKQREALTGATNLDSLINKEKELQNNLTKLDERMDIYKDEVTAAEEKEVELLNKISNASKRIEYRLKIENIEKDRERIVLSKDRIQSTLNENFFKRKSLGLF